ncbi:hypothetical protein BC827DRAFT_1155738 [Russula dissimulans]|nr:hypothetical protein BC827DRAFT_1155738 [Russula dissimulans]
MDERASPLQDNGSVAQRGGVVQGGVVVQRGIGTQESGLNGNNSNAETNEDLGDNSHLAALTQGQPGKISKAMVIERPSWQAMSSNSLYTLSEESSGDNTLALIFIKDALLGVAEAHKPETGVIHQWLQCDSKYLAQIMDLPRAQIAIFRGEIKGYFAALVRVDVLTMPSPAAIAQYIDKQLSDYYYIYPKASCSLNGLMMRSRPYRNDCIIAGIHETFFTGGDKSFSKHFNIQFPVSWNQNGKMVCEVPVHMVALVATVLYAVLKEWQSGTWKSIDFSSLVNLDTYIGHTNTLERIEVTQESGFHVMMADIYAKASVLVPSEPSTIVVANIDYNELKG